VSTLVPSGPSAHRWSVPSPGLPDLAGHVIRDGEGLIIFDPPAAPGLVQEISALGAAKAIVITGAHHDRAAGALRARLGMPALLAPKEDVPRLKESGLLVDDGYEEGEALPGWEAIRIPGMPPFGPEWAFFRASDATLILSDLAVFGESDRLYPEGFGVEMDPHLLVPYVKALAARQPRRILPGHGDDVLAGGTERLEALCRN